MDWSTSLPAAVLVLGWLALALLVVIGTRVVVRVLVPSDDRGDIARIAGPLMPALGAVFGVMVGLTLANEAVHLRAAEDVVAQEAAAASRLAWAATSARVDAEPVHAALKDYLRATRTYEWRDAAAEDGDPRVLAAIARLERAVRAEASNAELGTAQASELLAALDAVTTTRRERTAAAARRIPALYVVTLVAAGVALIVNAGALTGSSGRRPALLVGGLAVVVGLSLALLFAMAAPWRGPMVVGGGPIDAVVRDIGSGVFG